MSKITALILLYSLVSWAELQSPFEGEQKPKELRVKERYQEKAPAPKEEAPKPKPPSSTEPSPELAEEEEKLEKKDEAANDLSLSILAHTPLGAQNTYDVRFKSFGGRVLLNYPIHYFDTDLSLHVEGGLGFTFSRFQVPPSSVSFLHGYLLIPIQARLVYELTPKVWSVEAIAGFQTKLAEYDSRPSTNGGFSFASDFFGSFDPEIAVGMDYSIGESTKLRLIAGYLFLSGGVEFVL